MLLVLCRAGSVTLLLRGLTQEICHHRFEYMKQTCSDTVRRGYMSERGLTAIIILSFLCFFNSTYTFSVPFMSLVFLFSLNGQVYFSNLLPALSLELLPAGKRYLCSLFSPLFYLITCLYAVYASILICQ